MTDVKRLVFASLDNALDNGFDPRKEPIEDIIHDLLSYDAELENYAATMIEPFVREWLGARQ